MATRKKKEEAPAPAIQCDIRDCRTCMYSREIYDHPVRGFKVKCRPLDYYGAQAWRMLPRIAKAEECSRFKLSSKKLEEMAEKERRKAEREDVLFRECGK